jgi:hypothetical protein
MKRVIFTIYYVGKLLETLKLRLVTKRLLKFQEVPTNDSAMFPFRT